MSLQPLSCGGQISPDSGSATGGSSSSGAIIVDSPGGGATALPRPITAGTNGFVIAQPAGGTAVTLAAGAGGVIVARPTGGATVVLAAGAGGMGVVQPTGGTPAATAGAGGAVAQPTGGAATIASGGATVNASTDPPLAVQQQMMSRWDATVTANSFGFDFTWTTYDLFPHPTLKGGSAEAYQAFAKVLLAFFSNSSTFNYFADNHLFDVDLRYQMGSSVSDFGTFARLINYLATQATFANIDADTRAGLAAIAAQIAALG